MENQNKVFEDWKSSLSLEDQMQMQLMDSFLDGYVNYEADGSDMELLSTNDIIDRMYNMGKLDMFFVNVYMRFRGYRTEKVAGQVFWKLWSFS